MKGQPTFAELWGSEFSAVFNESVLVAHNASFDLNVLEKTLGAYGIGEPEFPYICTMKSSKIFLPGLNDYRLPTLSRYFNVELPRHHNALHDAKACEGVFGA